MQCRGRLIRNAMKLRTDWSPEEATKWVDGVIGLEPSS